jgi:ComF family protein
MGMALKTTLNEHQIDLCIPMPLHRKKIFSRGYNQATLLCKGIQEQTGIGFDESSLLRIHHTETQTHKSRVERWTNVSGIFEVVNQNAIRGKNILIIDDVITTGASTESCAHTLLHAGAQQIAVASLAYTN